MKLCKDCKYFIEETPGKCYTNTWCNHPKAFNIVTGKPHILSDLARIYGIECGRKGRWFVPINEEPKVNFLKRWFCK